MHTSNIEIRQAHRSDAPGLLKLNDLFNGEGCNSLENIEESLETNTKECVCVATKGDTLVGFCCGQVLKSMCYPVIYAEITELFVIDEFRRQGVGGRLLGFMESWLREKGVQHFHILTFKDNAPAKALYRSCGYAETSEMLLDKG